MPKLSRLLEIVARFLEHSWDGIDYKYDRLTVTEHLFCTREEFECLAYWVQQESKR